MRMDRLGTGHLNGGSKDPVLEEDADLARQCGEARAERALAEAALQGAEHRWECERRALQAKLRETQLCVKAASHTKDRELSDPLSLPELRSELQDLQSELATAKGEEAEAAAEATTCEAEAAQQAARIQRAEAQRLNLESSVRTLEEQLACCQTVVQSQSSRSPGDCRGDSPRVLAALRKKDAEVEMICDALEKQRDIVHRLSGLFKTEIESMAAEEEIRGSGYLAEMAAAPKCVSSPRDPRANDSPTLQSSKSAEADHLIKKLDELRAKMDVSSPIQRHPTESSEISPARLLSSPPGQLSLANQTSPVGSAGSVTAHSFVPSMHTFAFESTGTSAEAQLRRLQRWETEAECRVPPRANFAWGRTPHEVAFDVHDRSTGSESNGSAYVSACQAAATPSQRSRLATVPRLTDSSPVTQPLQSSQSKTPVYSAKSDISMTPLANSLDGSHWYTPLSQKERLEESAFPQDGSGALRSIPDEMANIASISAQIMRVASHSATSRSPLEQGDECNSGFPQLIRGDKPSTSSLVTCARPQTVPGALSPSSTAVSAPLALKGLEVDLQSLREQSSHLQSQIAMIQRCEDAFVT